MADSRSYAWTGTPFASTSVERVNGVVARTNLTPSPDRYNGLEPNSFGLGERWFGGGGSGRITIVTAADTYTHTWDGDVNGSPSRQRIKGGDWTRINLERDPRIMNGRGVSGGNGLWAVSTTDSTIYPSGKAFRVTWSRGPTDGWNVSNSFTGVVAGTAFTASMYARASYSGAIARVVVEFQDENNVSLGYNYPPSGTLLDPVTPSRMSWSGVVPANAVRGNVFLDNGTSILPPDGAWVEMSSVLLESTDRVLPYFDGSSAPVPLEASVPGIPNYLRKTWTLAPANPNHAAQDVGWSFTGGGSSAVLVTPGEVYSVSYYMRASRDSGDHQTVFAYWLDILGNPIPASANGPGSYVGNNGPLPAGQWVRHSYANIVVPAGAARMELRTNTYLQTMEQGDYYDFTGVLIERSASVGSYFDGSLPWDIYATVNTSSTDTFSVSSTVEVTARSSRSSQSLTSAQVAVEFANIVERISDDESMAWGSVPAVLSVDYEQVGPFRVGDSPLTAWAIEVDSEVNLYGVFDSGEVSILDPEGNVVAVRPSEFIDSDTLIVTIPVGTFTTAGIYRLVPRLLGRGAVTLQAVSVIIEAEDGWHDLESARDEWQDAPAGDPQLFTMLQSAKVQCLAFAPALSGRPPANYRQAQLLQARALWQAVRTNPDGQLDANGFSVQVYPLDRNIRALLRPRTGVPVFA